MPQLPLRGCPQDAVSKLSGLVAKLVDNHVVAKFYVGRTTSVTVARSKDACDHFFTLYASPESHSAVIVEDSLNKALNSHPKRVDNVEFNECKPDGKSHYVYAALWLSS
jgi:hypothetical protein